MMENVSQEIVRTAKELELGIMEINTKENGRMV